MDVHSNRFLTVREVADHYRTTGRTVQRWIREGKLRAVRMPGGRGYRIDKSDVDAFVEASSFPTAAAGDASMPDAPVADAAQPPASSPDAGAARHLAGWQLSKAARAIRAWADDLQCPSPDEYRALAATLHTPK